jgi:hypothetical protein
VPLSEMDEHVEFHQMQMALNAPLPESTAESHINNPEHHHPSASSNRDENYHSAHASFCAPDHSKRSKPPSASPSTAGAPSFPATEQSRRRPTSQSPKSGKMPEYSSSRRPKRGPNRVSGLLLKILNSVDSSRPKQHQRLKKPRNTLRLGVSDQCAACSY